MGRRAFTRFLTPPGEHPDAGVRWGGDRATWDELLRRGRERATLVREQHAYAVDPAAGLESLVSLLAVATVPDTVLLWVSVESLGVAHRRLAPGLYAVDNPVAGAVTRPLWGVATSGSSGTPKVAIGFADTWELVALHYERAMLRPAFDGRLPTVLATCLPLQFSAAFFMTVLPALMLRRDLVVFEPHDWSAAVAAQTQPARDVFVLAVPALAAAACLATPEPVDLSRTALFLGGGHVSAERVALIRDRFRGAAVVNLYGTAETGALAIDPDPGHNEHVGHPIAGKAVWLTDVDEHGVGMVATTGPDCSQYVWRPGVDLVAHGDQVTGTDYGRFDADGRLCLEGRVDGGEKLGGLLVYPRTIERHLLALSGVSDARVLVRRGPSGLEHLAARVVGRVDEAAVLAHCAALPAASRPTRVECIAERDAVSAAGANGKL